MSDYALPDLTTIRKVLKDSSSGPMKPKELAKELDVPKARYRDFKDQLRKLEQKGDLYRNRGNRYAVPSRIHLSVGELRVIRSGDAFMVPDEAGETDVFVAARHQESAMDGDRVVVRIEGRPAGKNPVGRVVKVLERARPTLVGHYHRNPRFGFVTPLDRRVGRDVMIPEGSEGEAEDGDVVVVRVTHFGSPKRNAVGEVESVLGPMEDPGVDVLAILHGHGLPKAFPPEVEEEAEKMRSRMKEPGEREDLRDRLVFTIDPSDAQDHDDALSIEPAGDGVWEVGIHIADVAHFVPEGSAIDLEAIHRGTSVYLVDQVVPMLPHVLSNDLCSLTDGEDRLALSLLVELDEEGRVRKHRFTRSWIRSRHSLNYEEVQRVLGGEYSIDEATDQAIQQLQRLAKVLRERRKSRGSLDFDLPEARVVLGAEGEPTDIQKVISLESHRLIEAFMVLANEVTARETERRKLPVPFRIHEPPASDRKEELREFLQPLGHSLPQKGFKPTHLQQILEKVKGRPEEGLVSTVILRSMSRARYAVSNEGHFGLASEGYLHFTSPIRRYPDLLVHRAVNRCIVEGRSAPDQWRDALEERCERCSDRERVAQQAERDSVEMKKIEYMKRHLGDDFLGTIAGVTSFGFFVLLDEVFVEGLVHVSNLGDDYYTFLPDSYALAGERSGKRFQLGDRVKVQVMRADKEERQIDFRVLEGPIKGERAAGKRSEKEEKRHSRKDETKRSEKGEKGPRASKKKGEKARPTRLGPRRGSGGGKKGRR